MRTSGQNTRMTPKRLCLMIAGFFCVAAAIAAPGEGDDFSKALKLYKSHRFSEARACFARFAVVRPNDVEIDFYLGRLAWWFDDDHEAVKHLERAAHNAPQDARVQNALGDAYGLEALDAGFFAKFGWAKKCLTAHELAVRIAPDNLECRWGLLGYYFLAPVIAGGGSAKAFAQAEAIRKLDPMAGRIAFATLYLSANKNGAAFAEFDGPKGRAPDDFLSLYHIGRCAALSGEQLERGAAALRRCLGFTPPEGDGMPTQASVHFRLGNILEKQGNKTAAEREYAEALREQPDFRSDKTALTN
jgi:tetratricopeptide (TPR) repeat protein